MAYNKKTWANGDLITKESMNNIENGIYKAHDEIETLKNNTSTGGSNNASDISITDTGNYFTNSDVEGALQEVGSQIKDIANNMENINPDLAQNDLFLKLLDKLGLTLNDLKEKTYNLPRLNLVGDITGISADTKVTLDTELLDVYGEPIFTNKKCTLKWQGSSSLGYPKKNYSYTLFESDGTTKFKPIMFDDVGGENKYHLKANYIDWTHARNIVIARLTKEAYKSNLPNNARGCIDGFPILVYINDVKQGIYTFNLSQSAKVYKLDDTNENHLMYRAEWNTANHACGFRQLSTSDNDWEERFPETGLSENRAKLNRLISFVMNSNDDEFKNNFNQYMNLEYAIDYWIWAYYLGMIDSLARNLNLVTYDGLIWYPTFYDMDNAFGYGFIGTYNADIQCPNNYQCTDSLLWERLSTIFASEIKERYNELRNSTMNSTYVYSKLKEFVDAIGYEEYTYDKNIWSGILGTELTMNDIKQWIINREEYCDSIFNSDTTIPVENVQLNPTSITLNITSTLIEEPSSMLKIVLDGTQTATIQGGAVSGSYGFEIQTGIPVNGTLLINDSLEPSSRFSAQDGKLNCLANSNSYYAMNYQGEIRIILCISSDRASTLDGLNAYMNDNPITIYLNQNDLLNHDTYALQKPSGIGSTEWINTADATFKELIPVTVGENYKIVHSGAWCGLYTFDSNMAYLGLVSDTNTTTQTITIEEGVSYIALKCSAKGAYGAILYKVDDSDNILENNIKNTVHTYETSTLTATLTPSTASNKNVTWNVDNDNVIITPSGLECSVQAQNIGSSVVTVETEDGQYTSSCSITVQQVNS